LDFDSDEVSMKSLMDENFELKDGLISKTITSTFTPYISN
jgi:hypothetical protein